MDIRVDEEICIGCGNCEEICPAVFRLKSNDKAEAYDPDACDSAGCCEAAEENCPVSAIIIEED
jgi:ferredoxin